MFLERTKEFNQARQALEYRAQTPSQINHYLTLLFDLVYFKLYEGPAQIVELGVGSGNATCALLGACKLWYQTLASIDLVDCSKLYPGENWEFMQGDSRDHKLIEKFSNVGVLFLDTSHLYDNTKVEIALWAKTLMKNGLFVLHDTNLTAWDNQRGVIRALQEWLGFTFDETRSGTFYQNNFTVQHYPYHNGLTIVEVP